VRSGRGVCWRFVQLGAALLLMVLVGVPMVRRPRRYIMFLDDVADAVGPTFPHLPPATHVPLAILRAHTD